MLQPTAVEGQGIVGIYSRDTTRPDRYRAFSWRDYEQIRGNREPFDAVMAYNMTLLGVSDGDSTRRSFSAIVSSGYFSTLDVRLAAGREFSADEERPESDERVVIVGHQFARKAGLAPAAVLGQTVRLNAREFTIVGVAPEGFSGTMALVAPEFWLPLGVYAKRDRRDDARRRFEQAERREEPRADARRPAARGPRRRHGAADDRRSLDELRRQSIPSRTRITSSSSIVCRGPRISTRPQDDSSPGDPLGFAHGHGVARVAHRLPQPDEHAARARNGAAQGDRAAARARQRPRARRPSAPDREPAAGGGRERRRTAPGHVGSQPARRFALRPPCRSS